MIDKVHHGYFYFNKYEGEILSEECLREIVKKEIEWLNKNKRVFSFRKMEREINFSERELRRWLKGEVSIRYSNLEKVLTYLSDLKEE